MLIGLNPILSPDLLCILASMGHGDDIAVVDANFPGETCAQRLVRLDGINAPEVVEAILTLMPLDSFVDDAARVMQVVGDANAVPEAVLEFQKRINATADNPTDVTAIDRFDFYDRAKEAFAIVQTGERRLYGNILLKKGVVTGATD